MKADQLRQDLQANGFVIIKKFCNFEVLQELNNFFDFSRSPENINSYEPGFAGPDGTFKHIRHVDLSDGFSKYIDLLNRKKIFKTLFNNNRAIITHSKISFKEPNTSSNWYPHSDNGYKKIPDFGYAFGLALEDISANSGPLLIYPKSHLNKYKHKKIWDNYSSNFQVTVDEEVSLENGEKILPLPIIMNAGDIAIWSLDTVHSSMDNTNLDTLRPFLIFEAQAFKLKLNERGELPFIINGNLRFIERLILKYTITYENILNFLIYSMSKFKQFFKN